MLTYVSAHAPTHAWLTDTSPESMANAVSRGPKQSPFIGKAVPLVENGVPLLYPRYTDVSQILLAGEGKGSKQKKEREPAAGGNGKGSNLEGARPGTPAGQHAQPSNVNGVTSPPDQHTTGKKRKKEAKAGASTGQDEPRQLQQELGSGKRRKSAPTVEAPGAGGEIAAENEEGDEEQQDKPKRRKKSMQDGSGATAPEPEAGRDGTAQAAGAATADGATPTKGSKRKKKGKGKERDGGKGAGADVEAEVHVHADGGEGAGADEEADVDAHADGEEGTGDVVAAAIGGGPVSGKGNAKEARRMRQLLGFEGGATDAGPAKAAAPSAPQGVFRFDFDAKAEAEAEAEAQRKLGNIMAGDTARAENGGFVPRRVYVGGMPYSSSESDIREYWGYCGEIEELDMLTFPDSGKFRGIVFITFKEEKGCNAALECDGVECEGQTLKVKRCEYKAGGKKPSSAASVPPSTPAALGASPAAAAAAPARGLSGGAAAAPKTPGYHVAYVGNLDFDATQKDLKAVLEAGGVAVTKVRLHTDKDTGRAKGYAHVHFASEEALDRAVAMNGTKLHGRPLRIGYGQPKKQ